MSSHPARWEGDTRGRGTSDGRWIAADVASLLKALTDHDWIAEHPEEHLLPHLQRASSAGDSPWVVNQIAQEAGVLVVSVTWSRPGGRMRDLRADAFALIGAIAESTTFVRQWLTSEAIEYRVTTGMLDEDGQFAGHGHLVLLRVGGPEVARLIANQP
jgi:hypothetical protein